MTQEEKQILLKDLCARLPYGVKIQVPYEDGSGYFDETVWEVNNDGPFHVNGYGIEYEYVKPYLFPLSSMTEGQKEELNKKFNVQFSGNDIYIHYHSEGCWDTDLELDLQDWLWFINWCYKNHFDIYGLIPMGLAIDATGLNVY